MDNPSCERCPLLRDTLVNRAVDILQATAHPVRLRVLSLLHQNGALSAGALQAELKIKERGGITIEQSALSHQLKVLRDHGLVWVERHGRQRIYHLKDMHIAHIVHDLLRHAEECVPDIGK